MNRLSPLIVRRAGSPRQPAYAGRPGRAVAAPAEGMETPAWMEDLRLFATGWVGGLVFFGTLFG